VLVKIALRNLFRRGNRFLFLILLLAFSAMVILSLASVFETIVYNLKQKGALYYGGDLNIKGLYNRFNNIIEDPLPLISALREILPPGTLISERVNYRNLSTNLFFAGDSVRQRIVNGIDFEVEAPMFDQMSFLEGGYGGMGSPGRSTPGILVSEPTARLLKARVGDDLLLYIPTMTGQINTAPVILDGIFRDSSLFGYYTVYMDIDALRNIVHFPAPRATDIAVFFPGGRLPRKGLGPLQKELEGRFPMVPLFPSQQALWDYRDRTDWTGTRYAVLSLEANLERVNELLSAVRFIAYVLIGLLLGIVFFGVTNSYRITVYERRKEIGTLRAMGLPRSSVMVIFMLEGLFLTVFSTLCGALAAYGTLSLVGAVDFSFISGFDIFLRGGSLQFTPSLRVFSLTQGLSLLAVAVALFKPILQAASIRPVEAMRENR
jgi:ABC-type lipoprotein release transport system permease subunit